MELGRGLDSLIPKKSYQKNQGDRTKKEKDAINTLSDEEKGSVTELNIEEISVNPDQPRKNFSEVALQELAASIEHLGVIQPLVVAPARDGKYDLIAGERRLRASKVAGLNKVPVVIRDLDKQKKLEVSLVENLQREDLNPIERALAYRKLKDEFNLSPKDIGELVGKSRPSVSNSLRLLNLPSTIQKALMDGIIGERNGYMLAGIEDEGRQISVFRKITKKGAKSSEFDEEIKKSGGTKYQRISYNYKDREREDALKDKLETKVKIKRTQKGSQLMIDFYSDDDLDSFIKKI